ncbi:MAG: NAD(P)-dependent oxidoreductase [Acidobacteria bacterium]|nr:NAD(P)-dependent oxidoreductase [Acidobacteriota bacterium]
MAQQLITGASGFIGRRLLAQLDPAKHGKIVCLKRTGKPEEFESDTPIRVVKGDLKNPESYTAALNCRTVIHLAALTGKAAPEEYFRVNAQGTADLIEQCERSGVENFLYVSTIAVKYRDKSRCYYAQSKEMAEQAVRQSRLRYLVVRPTIVIGPDGGPWQGLSRMARGRVLLMPGDGKILVQPIAVDDLATCLRVILEENLFTNEVVELGGAETISFERFLKKIHKQFSGKDPSVLRLPIKPMIATLSLMETLFYSALPVSVGQLSAFWQNSQAEPVKVPRLAKLKMASVDQMLERARTNECAPR